MPASTAQFTFAEGEPITSVEHFLGEIKRAGKQAFHLYFRGQGEPGRALLPSIGRRHYFVGREIQFSPPQERELVRRFRRHAYPHFGRIPSEWETLFLARHHGLPTRLLDWTSNPLVALYFAAFYENDNVVYARESGEAATIKLSLDGAIWAIERRGGCEDLDVFNERRAPWDIPGVKLVQPFYPSPRSTAQSGIFTLHGDPWTDLVQTAGRPFAPNALDISGLRRWAVPSRHKAQIVFDLEKLAVNSRTLFPDLDGLAKGLWQTEIIRQTLLP